MFVAKLAQRLICIRNSFDSKSDTDVSTHFIKSQSCKFLKNARTLGHTKELRGYGLSS